MSAPTTPTDSHFLTGPLFNEPMRVETAPETALGSSTVGPVGTRSERHRRVALGAAELTGLTVLDNGFRYDGGGAAAWACRQAHAPGDRLGVRAYFGLSVSRIDPLPRQLEAVCDHLRKRARARFLLADYAVRGKRTMARLLIRELRLRGVAERILIVEPSKLAFQWQRELQETSDEPFVVQRASELRALFGMNRWKQHTKAVTSLELAKCQHVLPRPRQVHGDLVVVDDAHRISARKESYKSQSYKLGKLLGDSSDPIPLLTAHPHKGDSEGFSLFVQLLDCGAYADVRSDQHAMVAGRAVDPDALADLLGVTRT